MPDIECYPNGRNGPRAPECVRENIVSYPTWIIGGKRYEKVLRIGELARFSGFVGSR